MKYSLNQPRPWQQKVEPKKEVVMCKHNGSQYECPNLKEAYSDYECESYRCSLCGYSYKLYYDEMQ